MPTVSLPIGGRTYDVACRPGGEAALEALARVVDDKVRTATATAGQIDEPRRLLYAALLLAEDAAGGRAPGMASDEVAAAIERLAARVEKLAARLETEAATH